MQSQNDRYKRNYDRQLGGAQVFQDYVSRLFYDRGIPLVGYASAKSQLKGENFAGFEIKHDKMMRNTGNIWIETHEKKHPGNPNYVESGILRNDNTWLYLIGDYTIIYTLPKKYLLFLYKKDIYAAIENNQKTSWGFLMPIKDAAHYSVLTLPDSKDIK